jgi:hypothetical protein
MENRERERDSKFKPWSLLKRVVDELVAAKVATPYREFDVKPEVDM